MLVVLVELELPAGALAADLTLPSLKTCQVPPKPLRPSPVATPLLPLSSANVYSGWPLSVTWVNPLRWSVPSFPLTPAAL